MQLAPMLTLCDVSKRGWHTCAQAESKHLSHLPTPMMKGTNNTCHPFPFPDIKFLSPEAAAIVPD